ncbi:putative Ig domain-containing protein [Nonomuraea aurantiaca]|uniref:putative Ig domain-containing protein n=1 Tax=Nonomuraea aurantiaca TaxID=2878562 RepID=UPI001CDA346E|nr:putative Ig domain-containing protein [Nonomuraea aurantiaca]MCA2228283.1 putative Ig domain-containing protein [Nonomuraea aurantiaca]
MPRSRRLIAILLGLTLVMLAPALAQAVATTVFDQPFHNNTANGTGAVSKPALPAGATGSNIVCLTASGNTTTGVLRSCPTSTDAQGSGKLRLTDSTTARLGGFYGATTFATQVGKGLDVTFNAYQYGGGGADGLAFAFAAADPVTPVPPTFIGQGGGALGYSAVRTGSLVGLNNAYLGVGLDIYGSFSSRDKEGTNCTDPAYISAAGTVPGQVLVRGPGAGITGYCAINSTAVNTSSPPLALRAATRTASTVPVEVVINPTTGTILTPSGLSVAAGQYKIEVTQVGGVVSTLSGALPIVPAGLYPGSTWTTAGIPKQLTFGLTAAAGGVTDFHEADEVKAVTLDPAPVLSVAQTSYVGASPQQGDPVTYTVTAGVAAGPNAPGPVTVIETVPTGVKPLGAYGLGWVCQTPVGQTVTCVNSNGPFTNGATLAPIQVVAIVTGGSVTPALIQSSSTATASATDAVQGVSSSTTAGTLPTAPGSLTLSPASGPSAGGSGLYQAENATLSGGAGLNNDHTGYTGTGFVDRYDAVGAMTTFTVNPGPAGNYQAALRYSNGPYPFAGTKTVSLYVNGVKLRQVSFPSTGDWETWAVSIETVTLNAGTNTIAYSYDTGDTGYINLDALTMDGVTVSGTDIIGAKAVEIGTTAQFQAGTPTTLLLCPAGAATGCFTVNGNGTLSISSMPAHAAGAVQVKVVTNGVAGAATYTYVDPLALAFTTPPAGQVGVAYSRTLTSTGGTSPLTWSISAGSLPPGLTLASATGIISGTPTTAGVFSFTVMVADAGTQTATQPTTLTVAPGSLSITVPGSANLGSVAASSPTLSNSLGTVTVTDNRGNTSASWTVTVSATSFTTGTATAGETIATNKIAYSSGSGSTTGTGTFVPGNLANGSLPGPGASWITGTGANSVTWNPTVTFTLIPSQVAGSYSGTITHSVA